MMQVGQPSLSAMRIARSMQIGQLLRHHARLHVLAADVLEQAGKVDLLLVGAAHRRALGLPDDRDHRHVIELGVVQPVEQMDRPWPAGRDAHADLAGELGESDGLERRHLLVPGLHELRVVACALPRREQPVDPVAGVPEDLSNVPFPQSVEQDVTNGILTLHTPSLRTVHT